MSKGWRRDLNPHSNSRVMLLSGYACGEWMSDAWGTLTGAVSGVTGFPGLPETPCGLNLEGACPGDSSSRSSRLEPAADSTEMVSLQGGTASQAFAANPDAPGLHGSRGVNIRIQPHAEHPETLA